MVRFHWHVEDGSGASIPHGAMSFHKDTAVQHIYCNIEIPGEPHAQACITVPGGYLSEGKVKEIGILLGHDTPESWDGPLLTGIAVALAEAGASNSCQHKLDNFLLGPEHVLRRSLCAIQQCSRQLHM